jgi:UDP-GlcNAc3NAcA epimerase
MKIVTIVGARPQFIKASAFSKAIAIHNITADKRIEEIIIHTGQHFDQKMSDVFFEELGIPKPDINLGISGLSHGAMTGSMLVDIEKVLLEQRPDMVLIYGDTNSTLAGALAACKLHIPIAHVEAGLRSFNMKMPEEVNRILSDRVSTLLFCPTQAAVQNLALEGIVDGVSFTGDIMFDVVSFFRDKAELISLDQWGIKEKQYNLVTIHRAENTDSIDRLESILAALNEIAQDKEVVLPIHPRTRNLIAKYDLTNLLSQLTVIEPVSYLEMIKLQVNANKILTDSGGIQKEAFFHKVPCITLRDETEWVETVSLGWNQIVGSDKKNIVQAYYNNGEYSKSDNPYGKGDAAAIMINTIKDKFL